MYLNCLHCERPLEGRLKFCGQLCKSAEFKRLRQLRAAEDTHWDTISTQATYQLTDVECLAIEARLAANDHHVFDGNGWRITDARDETNYAETNGLRESWADKGASLDVWQIRKLDRARFGGIVVTPELAAEMVLTLALLEMREWVEWSFKVDLDDLSREIDQLNNPEYHLKTFGFEIDELYELETGEKA